MQDTLPKVIELQRVVFETGICWMTEIKNRWSGGVIQNAQYAQGCHTGTQWLQ